MFIAMVIFAPTGLAGIIQAHEPIRRAGRLGRLLVPYLRLVVPSLGAGLGFVGLVELMSFLTIGAAQGKKLVLFGDPVDVHAALPWAVSAGALLLGGLWLRYEAAGFHRIWESLTADAGVRR
jgi:branched-chain amino acid transport system permease protein